MNTLNFQNLPSKTFDAVGIDRVCGNVFSLAPQGEKAGLFCEDGEGKYDANIHFPEKSKRLFFVRSANDSQKEINLSLRVEKNANIVFVVHLSEKQDGQTSLSFRAEVGENANLSVLFFHFSEGSSDLNFHTLLGEKGAKGAIQTAFFGKGSAKNKITVESVADKEETQGSIQMHSALSGNAFCEMHGNPILESSAQNARNTLHQRAVLLSADARIRAFPALSVHHDAVSASHAFSLARLSPEDVFYCASRGISATDAQKLLQKSILSKMLIGISDEALRDTLTQFSENFFEKNV